MSGSPPLSSMPPPLPPPLPRPVPPAAAPVRPWSPSRPGTAADGRGHKSRHEREIEREGGNLLNGPAGICPVTAPGQPESGGEGDQDGRSGDAGQGCDDGGDPCDAGPRPMDPRVRHVGDAIAMVCRFEQAQCVWSARVPLDRDLMPGTVLHMAYSPGLLALRFDTSDFEVRELLQAHLGSLESLVSGLLPANCGVAVSL